MSIDPADPRCPACDGPVGATSVYCMHCGADLVPDSPDSVDVTDADDLVREGGASGASVDADDEGLLDPDGTIDDTLTGVVGLAGGGTIGLLTFLLFAFATASAWSLAVALLAAVGSAAHLVRRRTVGEAIARSAYAIALLIFVLPTILFGPAVEGGSFGERVVVGLAGLLFTGLIAATIAVLGYVIGGVVGRAPGA